MATANDGFQLCAGDVWGGEFTDTTRNNRYAAYTLVDEVVNQKIRGMMYYPTLEDAVTSCEGPWHVDWRCPCSD